MKKIKNITTPIGNITIEACDYYITKIKLGCEPSEEIEPNTDILNQCASELVQYFAGERKSFTFAYKNIGTPFRMQVWDELEKIPYGETTTYKDIAQAIGNKNAVRAVGGANHHNNLWIVVPCHRVIGSNGHLTGYGGGIWRKEWLLNHEKNWR